MARSVKATGKFALTALSVGVALMIPAASGLAADSEQGRESSAYGSLSIFAKVLQLVRQDYVDESKAAFPSLIGNALRGMLAGLDPHSQFLDAREYKAVQDDTRSRFSGVGLILTQRDGRLAVVSVMDGSPGARAGILAEDQILKVDDKLTEKLTVNEVATTLRGDVGTPVKLVLFRPSTRETREIEVNREAIKLASVVDAKLLGADADDTIPKVGYVRVTQFNTTTVAELLKALADLEKRGMQALVLDLRDNPGGLLESAVEVASQFLPPNSMVVSTEGRVASQNRIYRTSENAVQRPGYPMAVVVNAGSASAAEILAGALKDLRRAVIVGETTFGKGSVQSVIPLADGTAIRLTTARYFTPSRQLIHENGIQPTIRATLSAEQARLLSMQHRYEQLDERERAELAAFNDPQLERAAETLKAVVLFSARSTQQAPQK
jgi:carboxyl-terminal processing protease